MRSYLYVPGDQPDRLAKCLERGADYVILDLEDAVPPNRKQEGREIAGAWIAENAVHANKIWVRVNNSDDLSADLHAVITAPIVGLLFPKCETVEQLAALDLIISNLERKIGIPERSITVSALVETAAGILNAREIARGPRVSRMQIGEYDLKADMSVELGEDEKEFLYARSYVVLCSAAAGINPPIAPVGTDFKDLEAFRQSTIEHARMGYFGRTCIHPAQVAIVNEVFTPSAEAMAEAQDMIDRYDAQGGGVLTDAKGRLLDEAVIRSARRVVNLGKSL
ncbi:unannotated protein [freshwater metagenome]|uniref:Unannotated protein n=1 Tax=freshwater metagenome TaxID=449393 RepID=A0A6J6PH23_9ZZZZ|nr:CoA ester lyase [Actinomycetota bacterium]MSY52079.1 CoA ester lyase [Actinomycetota bacterium]MSY88062.1 CoA ester lyase [Actinomycetota bacterium]MTA50024.1 CoA ester lyase [Actinomycetota bacterium]